MKVHSEKSMWSIFIFTCVLIGNQGLLAESISIKPELSGTETNNSSPTDIFIASETADPKKTEVVKQIRRLNEDGSYTVGYEADDGTFKIESRDPLGNVKGTYGYIDNAGEIKRVTYSSTNSTPPTLTSTSYMMSTTAKYNKTVSATTRRSHPTLIYPRSSSSTRPTVIQSIPRKRLTTTNTDFEKNDQHEFQNTTDKYYTTTTKDNFVGNLPQNDETISKPIQIVTSKPIFNMPTLKEVMQLKKANANDPMKFESPKPVYEKISEQNEDVPKTSKSNTIRRQLSSTITRDNPHMLALQQSAGDDSTDVYGGSYSVGTARPLFTTTTPRPKLVPFQSFIAAQTKLREQQIPVNENYDEAAEESSNGRIGESENIVTSNPIPVVHIPYHRDRQEERTIQEPAYRYHPLIRFKSREYLRDNPGAPIPIGNQRPIFQYNYQAPQNDNEQYIRENTFNSDNNAATQNLQPGPYNVRSPVTRIIPIPVDERGIPIPGYQQRYLFDPYNNQAQNSLPMQRAPIENSLQSNEPISTPVSTRDLKRLLQILLLKQNRLQSLMDLREDFQTPGPPYQQTHIHPPINHEQPQYMAEYSNKYPQATDYQDNTFLSQRQTIQTQQGNQQYNNRNRYDQPVPYAYRPSYARQQQLLNNQIQYDPNQGYESQRFIPRRRLYSSQNFDSRYDTETANTNQIQEQPEYLPPDVREALLLKMLMLAINPDFTPMPRFTTREVQMSTPEPRKKVRNVEILGEVGSRDSEMKNSIMTP